MSSNAAFRTQVVIQNRLITISDILTLKDINCHSHMIPGILLHTCLTYGQLIAITNWRIVVRLVCMYWSLNSGPHVFWAGALPFELHPQFSSVLFIYLFIYLQYWGLNSGLIP
jgi:hypothetical protein